MRVIILRTPADGNGTEYFNVPYTGDGTTYTAQLAAKAMQQKALDKNGSWADTYYVAKIEQVIP